MDLIQKAFGTPAAAQTAPVMHHKARPATTQGCFPTKHQQQQQQQLKRLSMASDAESAMAGPTTSSSTPWLYTTTASAAAAAVSNCRPQSSPRPKAQAFRPGTAAVTGSNLTQGSADAAQNPKARPGPASHPPLGSNLKGSGLRSVNITTSQAMHGLKDLYPDLWASTVPICRPDPAPNKNFISEWGESLCQGSGEAWKPYLATTSQLANLQVAKPVSIAAGTHSMTVLNLAPVAALHSMQKGACAWQVSHGQVTGWKHYRH